MNLLPVKPDHLLRLRVDSSRLLSTRLLGTSRSVDDQVLSRRGYLSS